MYSGQFLIVLLKHVSATTTLKNYWHFILYDSLCEYINQFINILIRENNYCGDHDIILAKLYDYLGDSNQAKKHAKLYLHTHEDILDLEFLTILLKYYLIKGNHHKIEFYNAKINMIQKFLSENCGL